MHHIDPILRTTFKSVDQRSGLSDRVSCLQYNTLLWIVICRINTLDTGFLALREKDYNLFSHGASGPSQDGFQDSQDALQWLPYSWDLC